MENQELMTRNLCDTCDGCFAVCKADRIEFGKAPENDSVVNCTGYNPSRTFVSTFTTISNQVHNAAKDKGWYDRPRNEGEMIALVHSELSEALEGLRHGNPPSDKIPEFSSVEEEFADVIIRIMDHAAWRNYRIGEAIIAKIKYNEGRSYMHGGKKF